MATIVKGSLVRNGDSGRWLGAAMLLIALAPLGACIAEGEDNGNDGEPYDEQATAEVTVTPTQGPVLCTVIPLPDVTKPFVFPGGLGGWAGTRASVTQYGNQCTPYYVIESTNTHGRAGIGLSANGVPDSAMQASSSACTLSAITVEAWGCTALNTSGGCTHWAHIGKTTGSGVWTPQSGPFPQPPCSVGASLPSTPSSSPYYSLRLGATAAKTVFVNGQFTTTPLPLDEFIGFWVIN